MTEIEPLKEFAKFWAAEACEFGSATDICDLDVAAIAGEASTDPHVAHRLLEQQLISLLWVADRSSPSIDTDAVLFERASDEALFSNFEVLDELRTPEAQIRRQIRALRRGSRLLYRERLARRLEFLLDALDEQEEPLAEDSPESLRQMLLFLEALPDFRCPTVTVTPFATFRAQWQGHPSEHFAVDFVSDGQVRFVVFAPDLSHPGRLDRVSGIVSPANAMKAIETYQVPRWAADAGT